MSTHAKLSPSQAERWMNCPGSISLSEGIKEKTSEPAAQGTVAHSLLEHCLKTKQDANSQLGEEETEDGYTFTVDEEMTDAVQICLDFVKDLQDEYPNAHFKFEHKVEVPGVTHGTLDVSVAVPFGPLYIIDYKHGSGVLVEVEENKQLMIYALAELLAKKDYDYSEVILVIVQPRARHKDGSIRSWSISTEELEGWEEVLQIAASDTKTDSNILVAGSHCHWCPAASTCPEIRKSVQEAVGADFEEEFVDKPPNIDEGEQLSKAMKMVPMLTAYCKAVSAAALARLTQGDELSGFKLVLKKSNRAWEETEKAIKVLAKKYGTKSIMTAPELLSPAKMEKLLPKDGGTKTEGKKLVATLVYKPLGGLTIAIDSDPRPKASPESSAVEDFGE